MGGIVETIDDRSAGLFSEALPMLQAPGQIGIWRMHTWDWAE